MNRASIASWGLVGLLLAACSGQSEQDLTAAAKVALDKGDHPAAMIHLKNALAKDPDSGQVRYLLGKTLLAAGEAATAAVELGKAVELQVPDDLVLPELARAMLATGEAAKLVAQHKAWRLTDPAANADVQTSVAIAYATQGDNDQAGAAMQRALQAQPGYTPWWVRSSKPRKATSTARWRRWARCCHVPHPMRRQACSKARCSRTARKTPPVRCRPTAPWPPRIRNRWLRTPRR
jgi:tetratricopeptide (TPR) repeat protein